MDIASLFGFGYPAHNHQALGYRPTCPSCVMQEALAWQGGTRKMAANKDLEAKLSLAEKALEKVDIYFKALREQWAANEGRVVSESGVVIDASADCNRLCDEAGSAVIDALSQIKQIRWKGC